MASPWLEGVAGVSAAHKIGKAASVKMKIFLDMQASFIEIDSCLDIRKVRVKSYWSVSLIFLRENIKNASDLHIGFKIRRRRAAIGWRTGAGADIAGAWDAVI